MAAALQEVWQAEHGLEPWEKKIQRVTSLGLKRDECNCRGCIARRTVGSIQTKQKARLSQAPVFIQYANEEDPHNVQLLKEAAVVCRQLHRESSLRQLASDRHACLPPHISLAELMSEGPTHALCRAIQQHDVSLAAALCEWGLDINSPLPHHVRQLVPMPERYGGKEVTPLLLAALCGDAHMVYVLLLNGAEPALKLPTASAHDAPVHNLFCEAIYNGHQDVAALLLLFGAQFNYRDDDVRVYQRFFYAYPWLLHVLMSGGPAHVAGQFEQTSFLHLAVACCDATLVNQLLDAGLDSNLPNHRGESPLDIMSRAWIRDYPIKVRNGHVLLRQLRVVRSLIAAGAKTRAKTIPTRVRACLDTFPPASQPYCVRKQVSAMTWTRPTWSQENHARWPPRFRDAVREVLRMEKRLGCDVVRRVVAAMAEDVLVWVDERWLID